MLSSHQIDFFRRVGYLRIERFFDEPTVLALKDEAERQVSKRCHPFMADDSGRIFRLNNLFDRSEIFKATLKNARLLQVLSGLLGPNIEYLKNRHNHFTVNTQADTRLRLHRDILQWSRGMVGVIIYLDDATLDRGATHIIPGSQFLPFVGTPNNGGTWMDEHHVFASLLDQAIAVPVNSGGILVFDGLLFHSVGKNITTDPRRSIAAGYTGVDELCPIEGNDLRELVLGERLYRGGELKWRSKD